MPFWSGSLRIAISAFAHPREKPPLNNLSTCLPSSWMNYFLWTLNETKIWRQLLCQTIKFAFYTKKHFDAKASKQELVKRVRINAKLCVSVTRNMRQWIISHVSIRLKSNKHTIFFVAYEIPRENLGNCGRALGFLPSKTFNKYYEIRIFRQ